LEEGLDRPPAIGAEFSSDQVEGLDAVGALVDLGDAGVADELFHAPFADIAVAAIDLLGVDRGLEALVGEIALDDGGEDSEQIGGGLALLLGLGAAGDVDLEGAPQYEGAGGLVERLHLHQHSAHVRVDDDRIGLGLRVAGVGDEGAALAAVAGIGDGVLVGDFALGEALKADAEAGGVHHDEHRSEALLRLADEIAGGFIVVEDAGRIAVDAHLLLDRAADDAVAVADRAVVVDEEFGDDEERDAFDVVRGAGDLGEDEVDDILGEVVLAGRDEYLGAADLVAAVRLRVRFGAEQAE